MNKKKIIIILLALAIVGSVIVVIVVFTKGSQKPQTEVITKTQTTDTDQGGSEEPKNQQIPPNRSGDELSTAIAKSQSYLASQTTGAPKFGIVKSIQVQPGWYVVKISVEGSDQPYKMVLSDAGDANGGLVVVAGPGTAFLPGAAPMPEAVRKAVNKL
jgi:hypothetical protein